MKLFCVELARTVWFFDLAALNPSGRSLTKLLTDLVTRYQFKKYPTNIFDLNSEKALRFEEGEFMNKEGNVISVSLGIYNDGVVSDTRSSTDDSIAFFKDVLSWIKAEHNLEFASENIVETGYVSQLTLISDKKLAALNPKLESFIARLSAEMKDRDGKPRPYHIGGITLWGEDGGKPNANAPFKFEQRLGRPLSENKYYSQAPVSTGKHMELLAELEEILS